MEEVLAELLYNARSQWLSEIVLAFPVNDDGSMTIPAKELKDMIARINHSYESVADRDKYSDRMAARNILVELERAIPTPGVVIKMR